MCEKQPEKIICIGDFADMSSLSSYDRGTKSFEGRRYVKDIEAAKEAMGRFLQPIREYNASQRKNGKKQYKVLISEELKKPKKLSITKEDYDGDVYCLNMPSGCFITRIDGKVAYSGNTANTGKLTRPGHC